MNLILPNIGRCPSNPFICWLYTTGWITGCPWAEFKQKLWILKPTHFLWSQFIQAWNDCFSKWQTYPFWVNCSDNHRLEMLPNVENCFWTQTLVSRVKSHLSLAGFRFIPFLVWRPICIWKPPPFRKTRVDKLKQNYDWTMHKREAIPFRSLRRLSPLLWNVFGSEFPISSGWFGPCSLFAAFKSFQNFLIS